MQGDEQTIRHQRNEKAEQKEESWSVQSQKNISSFQTKRTNLCTFLRVKEHDNDVEMDRKFLVRKMKISANFEGELLNWIRFNEP